jgi:hypothetical protein
VVKTFFTSENMHHVLHFANLTLNLLKINSHFLVNISVYPALALINSAGLAINIVNYWAVINGSYSDYVSGQNLSPIGSVTLVTDRLSNSLGAFQTPSSSYAQAPAGLYFASSSFSITMWVQWVSNLGSQAPLFDFSNGANSNNIHFPTNNIGVCSVGNYFEVISGSAAALLCTTSAFTVGTWYHVSITYNVTNLTGYMYVNGVQTGSNVGGMKQIQNVTRSQNYFGKDAWNGVGNWKFDEIKFHGRMLTAAEVLADFAYNKSYISFV